MTGEKRLRPSPRSLAVVFLREKEEHKEEEEEEVEEEEEKEEEETEEKRNPPMLTGMLFFVPIFFFWFVSKAGNRKDRDGSSTPVSGSLPSFFLMDLKSRRWNLKRVLILGHFVASFSLHKIISNINVEETSRND